METEKRDVSLTEPSPDPRGDELKLDQRNKASVKISEQTSDQAAHRKHLVTERDTDKRTVSRSWPPHRSEVTGPTLQAADDE